MSNRNLKQFFVVVITSASLLTNNSYALIVHDPIHTVQSALSTAQLVMAEITRLKQLYNQIKQATNFGDISNWKSKQLQELAALNGYIGSLQNIYGSIGAQTGRLRTRLNQIAISKMNYKDYLEQERQLVKQGNEEAVRRHNDDIRVLQKTQKDYDDLQSWESQIDPSMTHMASSQMMNQQLNKLLSQNSETLKMLVATRIEAREDMGTQQAQQVGAEKANADRRQSYSKKLLEAHEKARKALPTSPLN